tara:strand:- start:10884 stop:11192 length:309 start_codon:yes stop_codon:yes gene_type:complete
MKAIVLFFFLVLVSCEDKDKEPPVSREKFISIYSEVMILESYYQLNFRNTNIYKDSLRKSVNNVLEKNKVSFEDFEKTFNYYSRHQEEFQGINSELIELYSK